jgi:uncharacterized protein with FMN-binding domain
MKQRVLVLLLCIATWSALGDEVELLTGAKFQGTVVSQTADSLTFNANGAEMKFPIKQVYAVTVKGEKKIVTPKGGPAAPAQPVASAPVKNDPVQPAKTASATPANTTGAVAGNTRTKAEVEALIASEGAASPGWWDSVPLNVPQGLDLTWQQPPPKTWDANKYLGQYIWSTVNENPAKWKEGIKVIHQSMTVNQNDQAKLKQSMNALATAYAELLCDFARAAFWWRKGGGGGHAGYSNAVALSRCYWKLGNKDMAVEALNADHGCNPDLVRCWGDLGDTAKALQLGEQGVANDGIGLNQAMGDVCRCAGNFPQAITYYEKALAKGPNQRIKDRLQSSLDAAKGADGFNHLDHVPNGTYKATGLGYVGPVEVTLEVKAGKLESVKVTDHHEKQYYSSIAEVPVRILNKQGIKGVDTTTGATMTSEAIINAAAKALVGQSK